MFHNQLDDLFGTGSRRRRNEIVMPDGDAFTLPPSIAHFAEEVRKTPWFHDYANNVMVVGLGAQDHSQLIYSVGEWVKAEGRKPIFPGEDPIRGEELPFMRLPGWTQIVPYLCKSGIAVLDSDSTVANRLGTELLHLQGIWNIGLLCALQKRCRLFIHASRAGENVDRLSYNVDIVRYSDTTELKQKTCSYLRNTVLPSAGWR
jgi:hypothetical protein